LGTNTFLLLSGPVGAEDETEADHVDQALGSSQCLLMGTLANFTLSKRREILEKSSVNEILQDSLLRSISNIQGGNNLFTRPRLLGTFISNLLSEGVS
jgi:hypothetical protein